jgi:hypothetical protein
MRSFSMAVVLSIGVAGWLTGCVSWTVVRYDPAGIEPLGPPAPEPLTLYLFEDHRQVQRKEPPRSGYPARTRRVGGSRVGEVLRLAKSTSLARSIHGQEATAVTVTRAFAEGLTIRGFSIIDRTPEEFVPGQSKPSTRFALSGEVGMLWGWYDNDRSGSVNCWVTLRLYDAPSGTVIWEKTYGDSEGAPSSVDEIGEGLSRVLSRVVREAANDPTFAAQIRQSQ